jgi:hypothetical protein
MAILKRRILDTFEIADATLLTSHLHENETPRVENRADGPHEEALEIYKMEYERCTQRYNDLYNAAWTNFSYMALVAGGILSFGGSRFVTPLTAFLACLPLLFWWLATFEPLNRYGDLVEKQILKIEKALNALSISRLEDVPEEARKGLTHFEDFAKRGSEEKPTRAAYLLLCCGYGLLLMFALNTFLDIHARTLWITFAVIFSVGGLFELIVKDRRKRAVRLLVQEYPRVRFRVRIAAFLVLLAAVCFGIKVGQLLRAHQSLTVVISKTSEP